MSRAVFIGRFQPLHLGHYLTIKSRKEEHDLVVAIGSPEKSGTDRNPLNLEQRKSLLENCFDEIKIIEVEDEDRGSEGHEAWAKRLIDKSGADTVITRNPTVEKIIRQYTDAELEQQKLRNPSVYSGTEIRKRIRNGESWKHLVPECCSDEIMLYEKIIAQGAD